MGDTVPEVVEINYFRDFIDKLYALYSQSPKNMRELEEHARDVGDQVLKIRRVFFLKDYRSVTLQFCSRTVLFVVVQYKTSRRHEAGKRGKSY